MKSLLLSVSNERVERVKERQRDVCKLYRHYFFFYSSMSGILIVLRAFELAVMTG